MCGIAGRLSFDGPAADPTLLPEMIRTIRHRGPDSEGYFAEGPVALGHARLAIIDLSPLGEQPMPNEDGALRLVYNGEVYNYRELADELAALGHTFRSRSDSEVILHAYEQWGDDCLTRFNGMWAFALWDARRRRLFCARDRMGVKPFYYAWDGRELLFASEIKALLAVRPGLRRPNRAWLHHLLTTGLLDDADDTAFERVHQLPAAHTLVVDRAGLRLRRFWDYDPAVRERYDYRRPAAALRDLLEDAVRLRLRSDVPVGTCLSGGLDSSAIVALAARHLEALHPDGRVNTFTAVYPAAAEADESRYAEIVNRAAGAIAHPVEPRGEDLPGVFPKIVWHQDEPTAGPGLYSQWHVMERAQDRVRVLLDGQGSDELLAGYHDYLPRYLATLADRGALVRLAREYPPLAVTAGRGLALSLLRSYSPAPVRAAYARWRGTDADPDLEPDFAGLPNGHAGDGGGPPFADRLNADLYRALTRTSLPALLRYEDRNSMAFSIESRVPFLDYRVVEFCLGLPSELKIHRGETKYVLRRALEGVVPELVLARRDKKGYPTPAARWLRTVARDWSREILLDERTRSRRILSLATVEAKLAQHAAGTHDWSWQIWRWLSVELWHRQFVDDFAPPAGLPAPRSLAS